MHLPSSAKGHVYDPRATTEKLLSLCMQVSRRVSDLEGQLARLKAAGSGLGEKDQVHHFVLNKSPA